MTNGSSEYPPEAVRQALDRDCHFSGNHFGLFR
jgi:hypothetical protein